MQAVVRLVQAWQLPTLLQAVVHESLSLARTNATLRPFPETSHHSRPKQGKASPVLEFAGAQPASRPLSGVRNTCPWHPEMSSIPSLARKEKNKPAPVLGTLLEEMPSVLLSSLVV